MFEQNSARGMPITPRTVPFNLENFLKTARKMHTKQSRVEQSNEQRSEGGGVVVDYLRH